jgi:hypothetical protein
MKSASFESQKIRDLHRKLDAGQFAVPKLQRAFVWDGVKAAKLLDSIYRRMPVGCLVVWDTSKKNRELLRVTSGLLPAYNHHNNRVWFLLDGQQRLSVLHRIRTGGLVKNGKHRDVDFDRLVFRVTDGNDETRFAYRRAVPGEWVPMNAVLASNWRIRLKGLRKGQLNRVSECRERVLSYKFAVTRVNTDELEEARELFLRINSTGTPIGAADKAFARAAEFDLRERTEHAWQAVPPEFKGLSDEVMLQTRALIDGIEDVGERALERVAAMWDGKWRANREGASAEFARTWLRQQQATKLAIDLLGKHFAISNEGLLPSRYMIATLTLYFYQRPKRPTNFDLVQLRRWFWSTAVGQRYSGRGHRINILRDADYLTKLGAQKAGEFKLDEWIDPAELLRASYGQRSSVSDAFFCLLLRRRPQSFMDGHELKLENLASSSNAKHKHHFFPRALLKRWALSTTRINSVLNLCLLPADENSHFGAKNPGVYLKPYSLQKHFQRVLRSHLLPNVVEIGDELAGPALYQEFLRLRQELVLSAFEEEAGGRLFHRDKLTHNRKAAPQLVA